MGRIFVCGDTHQTIDIDKVDRFARGGGRGLNKSDVLIVAGDFGVLWSAQQTKTEKNIIDWYNELPFSIAFIDGNHENHDRLEQLPTAQKWGADVGVVSTFIFHLRRGRIYTINDKKIWAFGGGFSIDKARRQEYISWWKQELPSLTEMNNGFAELNKAGNEVDFIITHTCPRKVFEIILHDFHLMHKISDDEIPLQDFLQTVADSVKFKAWFFGHFHIDKDIDEKFTALYNGVVELIDES